MIKYLGSKRTLIPSILEAVRALPNTRTVIDLFSGTSRVGHALKAAGYRVLANDHNAYAATLARCYVQSDAETHGAAAAGLIAEFNALAGAPGYFTSTFCERSRFFQPKNGARIDAIRDAIARKHLDPELESILLVSLMEAADRVDSTTGLQMAYLKSWAPRAHNDLALRLPDLLPRAAHGKGHAHQLDALAAAGALEADAAYIDPPYNQHSYLGNYHIWESLIRWDKPPVYGVACKREDVRTRQSIFNSRRTCAEALARVINACRARHLIVSFSNEGFLSLDDLRAMLGDAGGREHITTLAFDFKRYVGAQIGIYNPRGEKVGRVGKLRNVEYLLIASHDRPTPALRDLAGAHLEPAREPSLAVA
ncbi:MAG TPA: DNA adenine methylase [Phycisphaerales bacterium]|nr:DNA adenine methylase [Phycisphaerales bacterium]